MKKNARKLFALATAFAMIALPTSTAFADITDLDEVITPVKEEATIYYVDPTDKIRVVVPTSTSLGITLDPQNLAATQGVGSWDPEQGGDILPHAVGIIVNKSAVPIKASVDFTLTDDAELVKLLDTDDVNNGTDNNMYLTMTASKDATQVTAAEIAAKAAPVFLSESETPVVFEKAALEAAGVAAENLLAYDAAVATQTFGKFVQTADEATTYNQVEVAAHEAVPATAQTTPSGFVASTVVESMAETGIAMAYAMNKADYYVVKGASGYDLKLREQDVNDNYDTASFLVGGKINKFADWSGYDATTKLTISATYSFDIISDSEYGSATKLGDSYNSIEAITPVAPSINGDDEFEIDGSAVVVNINKGTGSKAVSSVTSIKDEEDGTLTETTDYTYTNGTLTLTKAYIDSLIDDEVEERVLTVTFNTGATVTVTLTYEVVVPDIAPSAPESATFSKASGATLAINLGAGTLAATGISKLDTITDKAYPWDAATWAFDSETKTLTLKTSATISTVAVGQKRNVRVTFNNNATDTIEVAIAE